MVSNSRVLFSNVTYYTIYFSQKQTQNKTRIAGLIWLLSDRALEDVTLVLDG